MEVLGLEPRARLIGHEDRFVFHADVNFVDARQASQVDLRNCGTGAARNAGRLTACLESTSALASLGAVYDRPQRRNRDIAGGPRSASAAARSLCAEHVQQLGSESLLSNLMEVKD